MHVIRYGVKLMQLLTHRMACFSKFNCGSCSKKLQLPECNACHKMVNYFKVFDIPEKYDINEQIVKSKAKDLQKQFHPDKYNATNDSLQETMTSYSSYINEARRTLLDDLHRAIYLMELKGVRISEGIEVKDTEFMLEIFELNSEIENADQRLALEMRARIQGMLRELREQLEKLFKCEDLQKCKEFVIKYKYLHSALTNANARIGRLKEGSNQENIKQDCQTKK